MFLVLGEIHKERRPAAIDRPRWLTIPRRALFTGIGIFGAVGSGKTTCCMYPFAEQLLAYRRDDRSAASAASSSRSRATFAVASARSSASTTARTTTSSSASTAPTATNPLYNDLEAYALAYGIASLLTNLFGRGKEPFWQQAYTNVVKFIVLLHKSVYGYVTLFDVYECAINPDLLAQRIAEGQALFEPGEFLLVDPPHYYEAPELKAFDFEMDPALDRMKVPRSDEVEQKLNALGVPYTTQGSPTDGNPHDSNRREQFEAVERWFHHDWMRIEPKLRTSIVEGISVFLSLFDDSPAVKRTFCPPKECYDPVANADGRYGKPLPPFAELVETGAVVALNFPVASNPGLAKAIGVFLKQDFQRAMLGRIPKMEAAPERHWREVMFLCDEYHAFATVGESDPAATRSFFSLSRQARGIPIIATQSISSLHTQSVSLRVPACQRAPPAGQCRMQTC